MAVLVVLILPGVMERRRVSSGGNRNPALQKPKAWTWSVPLATAKRVSMANAGPRGASPD